MNTKGVSAVMSARFDNLACTPLELSNDRLETDLRTRSLRSLASSSRPSR